LYHEENPKIVDRRPGRRPDCASSVFCPGDGDSDGRFTAISAAKGIPMISVAENLDLVAELGKLFGKGNP
jgi:hypothetical protein